MRVAAEANRLRQGYGGPPKLYAKAEASAVHRIEKRSSTTLSDPQRDLLQLEHALEVVRARHKKMRGQDFLKDGAYARQREGA